MVKEGVEDWESEYEYPSDPFWEIERSQIHLHGVLGEGQFGRVMLASYAAAPVAVKMLKEGHTDSDVVDLVKEMEIMKAVGTHPNVINLLGVCTRPAGKPLYLVVEYAKLRNLKDYLQSHRPARTGKKRLEDQVREIHT